MKEEHVFDNPRNVNKFVKGFYLFLALLIVVDFVLPKHPVFPWEGYPSFYATYGFVACVGLVLVARFILRPIVKRKEDYYD